MKKNVKKMQLKKHSISVLNANAVNGGVLTTTSLISVFCRTAIPLGEDICFTDRQKQQ